MWDYVLSEKTLSPMVVTIFKGKKVWIGVVCWFFNLPTRKRKKYHSIIVNIHKDVTEVLPVESIQAVPLM